MSCSGMKKHSPAALIFLKANLGFFDSDLPVAVEAYLKSLLDYAYDDFIRMGAPITPGRESDDMDQVVHAAWMYRNGVTGKEKNEMLKMIIRNRQVAKALADAEAEVCR